MTRDEQRARQWAAIAVEFHEEAEKRGIRIPFPDLCFCHGRPHAYGGLTGRVCPSVSVSTRNLRVKALGELVNAR